MNVVVLFLYHHSVYGFTTSKLDLDAFSTRARVRDYGDGKFPWRLFKIHTFDISVPKRLTIPT